MSFHLPDLAYGSTVRAAYPEYGSTVTSNDAFTVSMPAPTTPKMLAFYEFYIPFVTGLVSLFSQLRIAFRFGPNLQAPMVSFLKHGSSELITWVDVAASLGEDALPLKVQAHTVGKLVVRPIFLPSYISN